MLGSGIRVRGIKPVVSDEWRLEVALLGVLAGQ
jgi:hypothetical protein